MMIIQNILRRLDYLGIGLSLFCAVHCALLPLIITFLSLFGLGFLANEHWETGIIAVLFLVGCYSLIDGYKQTKLLAPLAV
ncbi:MAG: MerC domain-containing protein, partial [Janthinobacterium lividum]